MEGGDADEPEEEKCKGESACPEFIVATVECGNGLEACRICPALPDKLREKPEIDDESVEDLVEEIEDLIFWENSGEKTDWNCYEFEYFRLFTEWRNAEKEVERIHALRLQAYLKSKWKRE